MTAFATVDANLQDCFRALAGGREHAEVRRLGGIHLISLGVRFQMFNAACLAFPVESEADFDRRLATASVHFGARGTEWSFWLCDGMLPDGVRRKAHRAFSRIGFNMATQMPGMLAGGLQPPSRPLPEIEIRQVKSLAELRDFCAIGSRCFRVPTDLFNEVFDHATLVREPFRAWVGYVHGRPVATSATIASGGSLGIYNVATLPEMRRAGYGEAILRASVAHEQEQHGPLPLTLQSTLSGLSLYERIGFEAVTNFRVWV